MKVEIEKAVFDSGAASMIMHMISMAKSSDTIDDFEKKVSECPYNLHLLEYGNTKTHVWVSYRNKRVLLIT